MSHLLHLHILLCKIPREQASNCPRPPALERMLTRADASVAVQGDHGYLYHQFGLSRQNDLPLAPFSALGDGLTPEEYYWLHADPVHFQLMRDSFNLSKLMPPDLTTEQARSLVTLLNQHFSNDGLRFFAPHPHRWYLRLDAIPAIRTTPLSQANNKNVKQFLPDGPDAIKWHQWLNEIQMLLHDHPINVSREQSGRLPINSIWPWGGGVFVTPALRPFTNIWSDSPLVKGLAQATETNAYDLPFSAEKWLQKLTAGDHLIVFDDPVINLQIPSASQDHDALQLLEKRWFAPLLTAMNNGRLSTLDIHLASDHQVKTYTVKTKTMWRIWRRSKPVENFLND